MIFSEPYRPYPIIYIQGYAVNHYNSCNFGTVINSSTDSTKIINPTTTSPVPDKIGEYTDNYISRNECKRIEEDKLAYRCLEYRGEVAGTLVNEECGVRNAEERKKRNERMNADKEIATLCSQGQDRKEKNLTGEQYENN